MPSVAKSPIGCFSAMHILSRGNDSETLRYLKQFTQWMEDTEGFAFERMDDGFHFVKGAGEDREVMPGSDLRSLPAKAFFRSFLERWPKDVTAEQILWVLEPSQPLRSYLEEQLNSDPGHLSSGLLPGTFLVSLEECEIALTHALRLGSVTSWGRPFDPDRPGHIRLHEGIPPSAFLGTPLLDWISDELGTRGHDQCVGGWFFPAPPIFTGVQFGRKPVEQRHRLAFCVAGIARPSSSCERIPYSAATPSGVSMACDFV